MAARSRSAQMRSTAPFWVRHPVALPASGALLAGMLLSGVTVVAGYGSSQRAKSDAQDGVRSNRDAAVRALVHQADGLKLTVTASATNARIIDSLIAPTPATLVAAQDHLSALARSEASPASFVSDLRGRIVAIYPAQPGLIGRGFSFRDWFKGASLTGEPYVSEGYRSAASGHPLVVGVASPVLDGVQRVGYVTVLWQLDSVRSLSEGSRADDGVTITVTDQRGQELTGALAVDDRGQPVEVPVSAMTRQALAGRSVSSNSGGTLVAAGPVPGLGWTVTAALPSAVALAPAHASQRSLEVTLGAALLLVLLSAVLARQFARRRAPEHVALRDSQERLRLLVDGTRDYAIFMLDPDGRIATWNAGAQRMKGYTETEAVGQHFSIFYTDAQRAARHPGQELELARTEGRYEEEDWRVRKDGSRFWANIVITALRDDHGALRGFSKVTRDLTKRHLVEAKFAGLLAAAPDAMVGVDRTGVIQFVNRQTERLFGYDQDELVGQPLETLVPEQARHAHPAHRADYCADPKTRAMGVGLELHGRRRDGSEFPVDISLSPFETEDGLVVTAAVRDITERQRTEQALRDSEERFRRVFDEALMGKLLVSTSGSILRVNATLAHLLGREAHALIGQPLDSLIDDPADRHRILEMVHAGVGELRAEMPLKSADGRSLWGLVALSWITERDGEHVLLVQVEDVTARREAEQQLTELALHDALTNLPNRRLLLDRCEHAFAIAKSGRTGTTSVAALFIDLDGFKPVNDRAGHDAGDQLLVAIAQDLEAAVRPTDTVARVGGDEFVVLLEQDDSLDYLCTVADRVTTVIRRQAVIDHPSLRVSASVGIARVDLALEPDVRPEQLLRRADAAMYHAKERGRDRYEIFDTDLRETTEARHLLAQTMRDGLHHDRISLVFQPVVDVDRNLVVGAEALMRLTDAEGHLMPTLPAVIAAETAGLAEALGERVLHLALDAARTWPEHMSLAVNVSARELTGKNLSGRVEQALQRHQFDPARLVLEITESSILSAGPAALAELEELRQRGVRVAIDDFGTAYATLQNLTTLPVDVLKVDTSFTAGLPDQRTHTAIVHGIASIALELDIPCIVEGVETDAQLAALRGMSVQAQGWLWGQPQGPEGGLSSTPEHSHG